jgi:hypothetical protein
MVVEEEEKEKEGEREKMRTRQEGCYQRCQAPQLNRREW